MTDIIYLKDLEAYKEMTEKQKKYVSKSAAYDLSLLPTKQMQEEMRAFLEHRISEVSISTLMSEKTRYNTLCRFVRKKGTKQKSFRDLEREVWLRKLKGWMLEEGLLLTVKEKEVYGTSSSTRSLLIRYFDIFLKYLEPEDTRPEIEKDIWVLDKLDIPCKENLVKRVRTLNFTRILQQEFRNEVKKGIYLNLQDEAVLSVTKEIGAAKKFSYFLQEKYPDIQSCRDCIFQRN